MMNIQVPDVTSIKSDAAETKIVLGDSNNPSEIFEYIRVHFIRILIACYGWIVHSGSTHIVNFWITISSPSFLQKTRRFLAILEIKTISILSDTVVIPKNFTNVLMYEKVKVYMSFHSCMHEQFGREINSAYRIERMNCCGNWSD